MLNSFHNSARPWHEKRLEKGRVRGLFSFLRRLFAAATAVPTAILGFFVFLVAPERVAP